MSGPCCRCAARPLYQETHKNARVWSSCHTYVKRADVSTDSTRCLSHVGHRLHSLFNGRRRKLPRRPFRPIWQCVVSTTHRLVPHGTQERLAKELEPYLKEIGGYSRPTDKTLDLLFDEACRESLRIHCLDRAEGFKNREQYEKVTQLNAPGLLTCSTLLTESG